MAQENQIWDKEHYVDDWFKARLSELKLHKGKDYREKDASAYLKTTLKGASKTKAKTGTAIPDFTIEKYEINNQILPIIVECKLHLKNLLHTQDKFTIISQDAHSIKHYALNGALSYARHIIKSKKYSEALSIGVAGDSEKNVKTIVAYVYGSGEQDYKILDTYKNISFLESKDSFNEFYEDITLSEEAKHRFLLHKRELITKAAKDLSKMMNDNSILPHERALFVAASLLAMQEIRNKKGAILKDGLQISDLKGAQEDKFRDSMKILEHIKDFLEQRDLSQDKVKLMLDAFYRLTININRDKPKEKHTKVAKLLSEPLASVNKQVFAYIYENIFKEIKLLNKHSQFYDIMGEMYNEFLKYALSGGKEVGVVLTPAYVTKMMVHLLEVNENSRVMDLATGSAGFLIAAMDTMIDSARAKAKESKEMNRQVLNDKISHIKKEQLLGIEESADIYALAATNMILRGDGSSKIMQNDSFDNALKSIIKDFKADRILLNPPFSYPIGNGMPFIQLGLDNMTPHALGAIIIQDSAGSGKAISTNQAILQKHTLKASVKMPPDLFVPMAGVQTSIYIFEAHVPHDFQKPVKFIDFRFDGYKRTEKALYEIDNPTQRYIDIIKIYKAGKNAKIDNSVYENPINLDEVYIEDFIKGFDEQGCGADFNFDSHKQIDTTPRLEDFKKCVSEYLAWEVSNILKAQGDSRPF